MRARKPTPVTLSNDQHEIKIYTSEISNALFGLHQAHEKIRSDRIADEVGLSDRGRKRSKDAALAAELRHISVAHPRTGYRMATVLLRRPWMEINTKRVQRLWWQEGPRYRCTSASANGLGAAMAERSC